VKKRRLYEIVELQNRLSFQSNKKDLGKTFKVLVEGVSKKSETHWMGKNSQNKVLVFPKDYSSIQPGDYVEVTVMAHTKATLLGEMIRTEN
jgi:tRNA-2-methylthio-N6-dimethylallyladenosine synthase